MLSTGLSFSGAAAALLSASAVAQAAVAPTPADLQARQSTGTGKCTDVHVFLAKGNNEPYPGRQGELVNAICKGYDSCDYEDVVMQNMLPDPYCDSVHEGGANTVTQIIAYNKKCPDSKLVLSGYSQGAHVVGDALSGGGGVFFEGCVEKPVIPLDPKSDAGKALAAVLTFGDTRHSANQPGNYQSGAGASGLYPRPGDQLDKLAAFADRHRDYCVGTDPICASADPKNPDAMAHLSYFEKFTGEAAKWVQEKLGDGVKKGDPSKTTDPVPNADGSSSASASASFSKVPSSATDSPVRATDSSSTTTGGAAQGSAESSDKPDSGAGMTLAPLGLCSLALAAGMAIIMG
ncbi:hypothetical protein PG985_004326 [Apiospora marii]|uniref:Cutinase n=1 Tax=Apiospora marii TaxID=335849 RepID=A0ABR1S910_9PEZI